MRLVAIVFAAVAVLGPPNAEGEPKQMVPERSMTMQPRINAITIAVDDLERSVRFYRDALGLPSDGIVGRQFEHGAVAFFNLQGGLILALFERENLALDAGIPKSPPISTEFSIGHGVRSDAEVDEVMRLAARAGAEIVMPARSTYWGGYAGYFRDPDQHLWEVLYNPAFVIPD